MSELDPEIPRVELQAIIDALNARGINNDCPECGERSRLGGKYVVTQSWDGKGGNPSAKDKKVWAYASLSCARCGLTRLFARDILLAGTRWAN